MRKKLLIFSFVLILVLSLTACSDGQTNKAKSTAESFMKHIKNLELKKANEQVEKEQRDAASPMELDIENLDPMEKVYVEILKKSDFKVDNLKDDQVKSIIKLVKEGDDWKVSNPEEILLTMMGLSGMPR